MNEGFPLLLIGAYLSTLTDFVQFRSLGEDSIAWKLLRANSAPLILSLIDNHFDEMTRRIPVAEFVNLVEADLAELNQRLGTAFDRPAQAYCESWRHDGYLVRRPMSQTRGETYEPSAEALTALSYVHRLARPHQTATESRLNAIVNQVSALAVAIDPSEERRRNALLQERAAIDEQLEALDQGRYEPLDDDRALEATLEILNLAQEIPNDFGRVRSDFETLNRTLYETIISTDEGYIDILDDIFNGVDRISQSSSGRSFRGFYRLLQDVDRSESFQDEINDILNHRVSEYLTSDQRLFLRDLIRILLRQSHELDTVKTSFAQSLRRFVQSRNYLEDRVLKKTIDSSLGLAHQLVRVYSPSKTLNLDLNLTSLPLSSVSRYRLMNPLESQAADIIVDESAEIEDIPYEELRAVARLSEIDFAELAENVNACLIDQAIIGSNRPCTVATVLEAYPATQGVASVVGLITLALEQGSVGSGTETIYWETADRRFRTSIDQLIFTESVSGS